jgi:hypothetical protein
VKFAGDIKADAILRAEEWKRIEKKGENVIFKN